MTREMIIEVEGIRIGLHRCGSAGIQMPTPLKPFKASSSTLPKYTLIQMTRRQLIGPLQHRRTGQLQNEATYIAHITYYQALAK